MNIVYRGFMFSHRVTFGRLFSLGESQVERLSLLSKLKTMGSHLYYILHTTAQCLVKATVT